MSSKWKSYLESDEVSDNLQLEAGGWDETAACDNFLSVSRLVFQRKKEEEGRKKPVKERTEEVEDSLQGYKSEFSSTFSSDDPKHFRQSLQSRLFGFL